MRWSDRGLVIGVLAAIVAATVLVSLKTFPPMALIMYGLPILSSVWVGWLVLTYTLSWPFRRAGLLVLFALLGVGFSLLRVDGLDGSFAAKITPRWQPTAEEKLLATLDRIAAHRPRRRPIIRRSRQQRSNCKPAIGPASAARRAMADSRA